MIDPYYDRACVVHTSITGTGIPRATSSLTCYRRLQFSCQSPTYRRVRSFGAARYQGGPESRALRFESLGGHLLAGIIWH